MRKLSFILSFLLIIACDIEDTGDCFQKAGSIIQKEINNTSYNKILVK